MCQSVWEFITSFSHALAESDLSSIWHLQNSWHLSAHTVIWGPHALSWSLSFSLALISSRITHNASDTFIKGDNSHLGQNRCHSVLKPIPWITWIMSRTCRFLYLWEKPFWKDFGKCTCPSNAGHLELTQSWHTDPHWQ